MRKFRYLAVAAMIVLSMSLLASAEVSGDYMESRSADVFTGPCFANGEMGLVGDQAILGWHIRHGSWNGVALDDMSIVGVVKARATLGDPYGDAYPAKSVLIVDERATPEQRQALLDFAHHQGGELFAHVLHVVSAPIEITVSQDHAHHGAALLRAGNLATIHTRPIAARDHICGNEVTYYPPLTNVDHSMPAVSVTDEYSGHGLGVTWVTHGKRNAFVGSFSATRQVQSARLNLNAR